MAAELARYFSCEIENLRQVCLWSQTSEFANSANLSSGVLALSVHRANPSVLEGEFIWSALGAIVIRIF